MTVIATSGACQKDLREDREGESEDGDGRPEDFPAADVAEISDSDIIARD